jgi:hypothetical protein
MLDLQPLEYRLSPPVILLFVDPALIRRIGQRRQLNMPTQRKPLPRLRGRRDRTGTVTLCQECE